jgi:hypothetical protein
MTTPELKTLFAGTAQEKNGDRDYLTLDTDENVSKTTHVELLVDMRKQMAQARRDALHARDIEGLDEVIAASHYRHTVEALVVELKPLMQKIGWARERLFEESFGDIRITPPPEFEQLIDLHWDNVDPRRSQMHPRTESLEGLWSLVDLDFPLQQRFTIAMKDGSVHHKTVTRNISIRTLTAMHDAIAESMQRMGFGLDVNDKGGETRTQI